MMNLEIHEIAMKIPEMSPDEFEILKADIKENGLLDQIVTYEGKILDGRNRYRALSELGMEIDPDYLADFDSVHEKQTPEAFVLSRNVKRRHLTAGQKAAIGWEQLKPLLKKAGAPKKDSTSKIKVHAPELTKEIAEAAGTSVESIKDIKAIEHKAPELLKEVKKGAKSIRQATKEAKTKVDGAEMDAALERIKKVCGVEFFDAVQSGALKLSAPEIVAYTDKPNEMMKRFKPLLQAGWTLRRALNVEQSEVTSESRVQHLLDHAFAAGGTLAVVVGDWQIKVNPASKKAKAAAA